MFVNLCSAFVYTWIVANPFIYYLYEAGRINRKDGVGDNDGGFFGCFAG